MAGWTKADFDGNYYTGIEGYMDGRPNTRPEVFLHYHRSIIEPILANRWENIIPSILAINPSDLVVIVGAAFGWGVESVVRLSGATVIGTDVSDFIVNEKSSSEEAEIDASISVVGLDPASGRGLEIKNKHLSPGARTKMLILNEDMQTEQSRSNVSRTLGDSPNWIITEDMIQDFSDEEIGAWAAEVEKTGAAIAHITKGKPRTAEKLNALTGHKCITVGSVPYEAVG